MMAGAEPLARRRRRLRRTHKDLDMSESTVSERVAHHWYARPVLFVSDVQGALRFYIDKLGFKKKWHVNNVCQVDRGGCEIILCEDPARHDKSRLFVELNRDGIDELRREISQRSVPTQKTWWGYDTIRIVDPDGNELLFPLDETNDRERRI
jgi:catechol 2,3-dioxygenase-like lactoylglutathione lyase family enzyme